MRRSVVVLCVAVILTVVVATVGLLACSDDEPPAPTTFPADDPAPTFDLGEAGGGCESECRAEVAMLDPASGEVRWETAIPIWNTAGWEVSEGTIVARTYPSDDVEGLVAVDSGSGRPLWQFPADDRGTPDVVVAEGTVVTTDEGRVVGIDLRDGSLVWERQGGAQDEDGQFLAATDDGVVIGHWDGSAERVLSMTGDEVWTASSAGESGPVAPVVVGNTVVVGAQSGDLRGVDLASGEVDWSVPSAPDHFWGPASGKLGVSIGAGLVFIRDVRNSDPIVPPDGMPDQGELVAIDSTTGEERWRNGFDGDGDEAHVFGDVVLVGSNRRTAFDAATGDRLWQIDDDIARVWRPSEDVLVLAVSSEEPADVLRAVEPRTGTEHWRLDIPGSAGLQQAASLIDGQLVVGLSYRTSAAHPEDEPDTGMVLALDPETGDEHWRTELAYPVDAPALQTDDGIAILASARVVGRD